MATKKSLKIVPRDGISFIDLGEMEIWDGADLALLRDSLTYIVRTEKRRAVGVEMSFVKYIPSGFFGMLFDYFEEGVRIQLRSPQPNVQRMLWFSKFFYPVCDSCYELRPENGSPPPTGLPATVAKVGTWSSAARIPSIAGLNTN